MRVHVYECARECVYECVCGSIVNTSPFRADQIVN